MGEDDIRNYLSRQAGEKTDKATPTPARIPPRQARPARSARPARQPQESYKDFSATHLFCPTCKRATPVRERVMLFLPDGDLHGYSCSVCATSVGTRKAGK